MMIKPKIFEFHIFADDAMGSNHNVDGSLEPSPSNVSLICFGVRKRERTPTVMGKLLMRSTKLS